MQVHQTCQALEVHVQDEGEHLQLQSVQRSWRSLQHHRSRHQARRSSPLVASLFADELAATHHYSACLELSRR